MLRVTSLPNRSLNRLIVGLTMILVIGIPLVGVLYVLDQYRTPGPGIVDRDIQVAEEALAGNPNLLNARLTLATAYMKNGRFADAVSQYDEILKAAPDSNAALLGRGSAEIALSKLDAAAADFTKVIDAAAGGEMANVDPQLESAYFSLGVIQVKNGQPKDAVISLSKAILIKRTDADALNLLGTALMQAGEPKRAVTALRQATALVPIDWCEPYAQMETAYTSLGDLAGAQYAGGMVALCEKRPEDAKSTLGPLTSGTYAVDALIGLGLVAEVQNDTAAAVDAYSRVLTQDPQNFAANTGLARVGGGPSGSPAPSPSSSTTSGS